MLSISRSVPSGKVFAALQGSSVRELRRSIKFESEGAANDRNRPVPESVCRYVVIIGRTYERAIANDAHTGSSLTCPAGYIAPAAIGSAARLYMMAHT